MKLILSNTAGIPIYEQIKEQIKAAIFNGELAEEEMLPSIRQLAHDLKISVITTTRAYNELEKEGLIATVPGKGSYVQAVSKELWREKMLREAEEGLMIAIQAAQKTRLSKKQLSQMLDLLWEEEQHD